MKEDRQKPDVVRRLREAGSRGADLSPGDPLCAEAAEEIEKLRSFQRDTWEMHRGPDLSWVSPRDLDPMLLSRCCWHPRLTGYSLPGGAPEKSATGILQLKAIEIPTLHPHACRSCRDYFRLHAKSGESGWPPLPATPGPNSDAVKLANAKADLSISMETSRLLRAEASKWESRAKSAQKSKKRLRGDLKDTRAQRNALLKLRYERHQKTAGSHVGTPICTCVHCDFARELGIVKG